MKVGYARVSTGVQNLDLQLDALKEHGCEEILQKKLVAPKIKDKDWKKPFDLYTLVIR